MRIAPLLTLALALASAPRVAEAAPPARSGPSVEALHQELTALQQKLAETETRALQDPAIAAEADKLDKEVQAAIKKADPGFDRKISRLEAIVREMEAKHAARAPEGELVTLIAEGQGIQRDLEATHTKVLESPAIKKRIEAFRKKVQARMEQLDPETPQRLRRMDAIVRELQAKAKPGA